MVIRQPRPSDRRVNVLEVTSKGKRIREKLIERLFEPPAAFRKLAARDQARFRAVMLETVRASTPQANRR